MVFRPLIRPVALQIQFGAHPTEISESMGHSTVQISQDRYGQLFPSLDAELSDGTDAAEAAAAWASQPGGRLRTERVSDLGL